MKCWLTNLEVLGTRHEAYDSWPAGRGAGRPWQTPAPKPPRRASRSTPPCSAALSPRPCRYKRKKEFHNVSFQNKKNQQNSKISSKLFSSSSAHVHPAHFCGAQTVQLVNDDVEASLFLQRAPEVNLQPRSSFRNRVREGRKGERTRGTQRRLCYRTRTKSFFSQLTRDPSDTSEVTNLKFRLHMVSNL